jgi:hypothetical protein
VLRASAVLFMNQSINWIIYGALNRSFRTGYRRLMLGCLGFDIILCCYD